MSDDRFSQDAAGAVSARSDMTPTGRLAAMADRLRTMSKALETTQAALNRFYGSLSDEQKRSSTG